MAGGPFQDVARFDLVRDAAILQLTEKTDTRVAQTFRLCGLRSVHDLSKWVAGEKSTD